MITNNLVISIFAIVLAGLSLFISSRLKERQMINLLGIVMAFVMFGAFLGFAIRAVNEGARGDVSILGLTLLIGGSVYFACAASERMRDKR